MASSRLVLCSCMAACLLALPLIAAPPPEQKQIMELYRRGLAGDANAVEQCIAKLEAVLKTEPGNQLARVYLGSALTLRSRDLGFGPKKLQTLKQGVAVMDEAVAAAPDDLKVRLARALTTSALPSILGHGASARADFLLLAGTAERDAGAFDEGDLQLVLYQGGEAAKKRGDPQKALRFWRQAQRYPTDPNITQKVEAALANAK